MSAAQIQSSFNAGFAVAYRDMMLRSLEHEQKVTRSVIAAIPDRRLDYKHDPHGRTALELADHIVSSELWFLNSITVGSFASNSTVPLKSKKEILARYDHEFPSALAKVKDCTGEHLIKVTDVGGNKIPIFRFIQICQDHTVHHRGQLSTFLRPMGATVPNIYSGSADDPHLQS
jgi:uncharacterized damage-inducible protein DinB